MPVLAQRSGSDQRSRVPLRPPRILQRERRLASGEPKPRPQPGDLAAQALDPLLLAPRKHRARRAPQRPLGQLQRPPQTRPPPTAGSPPPPPHGGPAGRPSSTPATPAHNPRPRLSARQSRPDGCPPELGAARRQRCAATRATTPEAPDPRSRQPVPRATRPIPPPEPTVPPPARPADRATLRRAPQGGPPPAPRPAATPPPPCYHYPRHPPCSMAAILWQHPSRRSAKSGERKPSALRTADLPGRALKKTMAVSLRRPTPEKQQREALAALSDRLRSRAILRRLPCIPIPHARNARPGSQHSPTSHAGA